jgi:hypothetical protein
MGFLSDMRKNLTGSWADVTLSVGEAARRGEPLPVRVGVTVKDADITVDSVIVEISCEEVVDVRRALSSHTSDTITTSEVRETLHTEQVVLATAQQLAGGSSGAFDGQLRLPAHVPPTVHGRNAEFRWQIRARLDMKGNDPDSGWQTIEVG